MGQTIVCASLFLYLSSLYTPTFTVLPCTSTHTATTIPSWFYTCRADTLSCSSSVSSLSSLSKRSICRSFFLSFRTTVCTHCTSITSSELLAISQLQCMTACINRTHVCVMQLAQWIKGYGHMGGAQGPKRVNLKMHLMGVARCMPITWACAKLWGRGSRHIGPTRIVWIMVSWAVHVRVVFANRLRLPHKHLKVNGWGTVILLWSFWQHQK